MIRTPRAYDEKIFRHAARAGEEEIDSALRCIEPLAARISLPAVKEKDSWYEIAYFVIAQ